MDTQPHPKFSAGDVAGLVSIGLHKMYLSGRGPVRQSSQPAVIIEAGSCCNSQAHMALQRLISDFARVYRYDRSGLGQSEVSSSSRSASAMAKELSLLLHAADVAAPYVLVAHSYGGIIAREFLALTGDNIVGMVLIDTNHDDFLVELPFSLDLFRVMSEGVDWNAATGVDKIHQLTGEEWDLYVKDESGDNEAKQDEFNAALQSHIDLKAKGQLEDQALGNRPLSIIKGNKARDFRQVYEAGLKLGNGTEDQRKDLAEALDRLEPVDARLTHDQMRLSGQSRYILAKRSGHSVQLSQPDLVAKEVMWVLNALKDNKNLSK
jgi:pimeloyl-ACP methyl ester carboxylesterase